MAGSARQHYVPAALIGRFGTGSGRLRERNVWAARRSAPSPFRTKAEKLGVDPKNPQLYGGPSDFLDSLWSAAEHRIDRVVVAAERVAAGKPIDACTFVKDVAPFVAQLLVRHPALMLDHWSTLVGPNPPRRELESRADAFFQVVDALIYSRRWSLVTLPMDSYFVSNDLGWLWLPGPGIGNVLVPVDPDKAFMISCDGAPTYNHVAQFLSMEKIVAERGDAEMLRDAMIHGAPGEVYTTSEERAAHARSLMMRSGELKRQGDIAAVLATHKSSVTTWMLRLGSPKDPHAASSRFMLATHRWPPCECRDSLRRMGARESVTDDYLRHIHGAMAAALQSLTPEQLG
jgi:hypothetical protein